MEESIFEKKYFWIMVVILILILLSISLTQDKITGKFFWEKKPDYGEIMLWMNQNCETIAKIGTDSCNNLCSKYQTEKSDKFICLFGQIPSSVISCKQRVRDPVCFCCPVRIRS